MWPIDRIKRHFAKKTIARRLPGVLKKNYGRHKRYTKKQIDSACGVFGVEGIYFHYAYAMYMSRSKFDELCGDQWHYDALRNEIAVSYFHGDSSFTFHDALDAASFGDGFAGDSGVSDADGDDSGMDSE